VSKNIRAVTDRARIVTVAGERRPALIVKISAIMDLGTSEAADHGPRSMIGAEGVDQGRRAFDEWTGKIPTLRMRPA